MSRELIVTTFLTLDGVMQAPGGPDEDESGGFTQGGWSVNYWDDAMGQVMGGIMGVPFDLVLGRTTYDIFARYWPSAPKEEGGPLNAATKHVASRGTADLPWGPAKQIEGDVVEGVAALKAEDGPQLQVHGSAGLLQTLVPSGLIDRFHLWTFPVVVGPGKRLFGDGTVPAALKLVDRTDSTTGVVIGTYEPAGALVTGSF